MKFLIIILFTLSFSQSSIADDRMNVIGTLKLVKRSFKPDIEDCLKNLKKEKNNRYQCKAVYHQNNGTESLYDGKDAIYYGSTLLIDFTTYGYKIDFFPLQKNLDITEVKKQIRKYASITELLNKKIYRYRIQKVFLDKY